MKNWKTTLGQIMTALSLVPAGLAYLNMADMPVILQQIGGICAFISFIWTGIQTKDHNVSGDGKKIQTLDGEDIGGGGLQNPPKP